MWVSQPFPTSCTASPSRRGLTSHSWWQVWGFWRRWVLKRPWLSSDLTNWACLSTGESGLGKSTLINSLFLTNLYEDRQLPEASGKTLPILSRPSTHSYLPKLHYLPFHLCSHDFLGDLGSLRLLPLK